MPQPAAGSPYRVVPIVEGRCDFDVSVQSGLHAASMDGTVFTSLPWFLHLAASSVAAPSNPALLVAGTPSPLCVPLILPARSGARRLTALSNFYAPEYGPIPASGMASVAADLLAQLARDQAVDVVDFRPLDTESDFYPALQESLGRAGFMTDTYFCFGNWYAEVPSGEFASYFEQRPSQLRNTWRRNRKKLERQGLEIEILTQRSPALETAITAYESIYNRSWKQAEPYPLFIPGLIRMTADLGWLRLGLVRVDGVPVASQIWFVKDGVASIFKLAYVEEFGKLSVGTILTHELMRHCIDEDRVRIVDYLSGDDAYKKDWMTHRRERRGVIAFNRRRIAGLALAGRHFGGRWLRALRAQKPAQSDQGAAMKDNSVARPTAERE